MFLTIVAGIAFAFTSFVFFSALYTYRPTKAGKIERDLNDLRETLRGYKTGVSFWKVLIFVAIWVVSGWYLFG